MSEEFNKETRLISIKTVSQVFGVSQSTILRMIDQGYLPKPARLSPKFRLVRFRADDLICKMKDLYGSTPGGEV